LTTLHRRRTVFTVALALVLGATVALGQQKVMNLADYGRWSRVVSTGVSNDGRWVSFGYRPNDGDETLHVKSLTGDEDYTTVGGTGPVFSEDARWAAYVVNLPETEAEKLRKDKKPVPKKVELLDLSTGARVAVDNASAFAFSKASTFLAVKTDKADREAKHDGTDLILRNLATGAVQNIGNVSEYAFNDDGSRLAYTVDAADDAGNGVYVLDLSNDRLAAFDSGAYTYAQLRWDDGGTALAVLRGTTPKGFSQRANVLLAFRDVARGRDGRLEYDPAADASFPGDMVVSERGELAWSPDLSRIFLGIKEQEAEPEKFDEPKANVDVWHWKDERVQSVQMVRADADRRATYRSALVLDGARFVRLEDPDMEGVAITEDGRWAIARVDKPYRLQATWGSSPADYERIDTATGARTPIVRNIRHPYGNSPDSRWLLFLRDGDIWVYDIPAGTSHVISKAAGVSFVNVDDDHPYEKPLFGLAGWTADGTHVIVNHRYDLWRLPLEASGGKPVCLTRGTGDKEQIVFRLDHPWPGSRGYMALEPDERAVDTSKPLLLSAYGEWTKKSGYYRLDPDGTLTPLLYVDEQVGRPTKAKDADVQMFTRQTFQEFPDYWVSGTDFANPRKVTDANPQQAEYAWGRRVLVDYKNGRGVKLQATLTLPAGYEPGKKYPMLVYFYERMSQRHHEYSMPVYDDRPHMSTYASDGYLVLMPDVVYVTGRPGDSALDCVTSAVKKVIELGYADPDHIGLQGHSWGGYESSFILTQTGLFAAIVTGAPVTNLVSFYDELYKSSGTPQQGIMEEGQVRMGTTPWKDGALYRSQSPVHQAEKITTPFLILQGTADGAVDWHQGLELYNAARRLGKEVIFLSYPDEQHHLTKEENQKDFQVRMKQFFDYHLKGTEAPAWMTEGVAFLRK